MRYWDVARMKERRIFKNDKTYTLVVNRAHTHTQRDTYTNTQHVLHLSKELV